MKKINQKYDSKRKEEEEEFNVNDCGVQLKPINHNDEKS